MLHNDVRGTVSWRKTWVMSARGYAWKWMSGGVPGPYTCKVWVDIWAAPCAFKWGEISLEYSQGKGCEMVYLVSKVGGNPPRKRNGYVEISGLTKDIAVPLCAFLIGGARMKEHQPQKTTHIFAEITMLVDMSATNGNHGKIMDTFLPLTPFLLILLFHIPCPYKEGLNTEVGGERRDSRTSSVSSIPEILEPWFKMKPQVPFTLQVLYNEAHWKGRRSWYLKCIWDKSLKSIQDECLRGQKELFDRIWLNTGNQKRIIEPFYFYTQISKCSIKLKMFSIR